MWKRRSARPPHTLLVMFDVEGRLRGAVVAVLALAILIVAGGAMLFLREPASSEVTVTPDQRVKYLAEMKENLNGHPARPRYDLVSEETLVHEGVLACEWLSEQDVSRSTDLRSRYFAENPRASGPWPFAQGRTPLRSEVLTNAWGSLCPSLVQDRIDRTPENDD